MRTPSGGARTNIGGYLVANMRQPHIKCARARRNYATNPGQGLNSMHEFAESAGLKLKQEFGVLQSGRDLSKTVGATG